MAKLRSQLARLQLTPTLNDEEVHDYARKAYHQKGLALVRIDELKDPFVKQEIINYADKKWGKR